MSTTPVDALPAPFPPTRFPLVDNKRCTCGALVSAVSKGEIWAAHEHIDALDCSPAEKFMLRLRLTDTWYERECIAVRDQCVCGVSES